jgi:AcrR family transcriptional regulator
MTTPVRRGRPPATAGAPHGRAEVESALIAAAADLFATRSPSSVSVRDIASAAGVNHGLVHRYFGSKDALLGAVLRSLADQVAQAVLSASDPFEELGVGAEPDVVDRYWRVDAVAPGALQRSVRDAAHRVVSG